MTWRVYKSAVERRQGRGRPRVGEGGKGSLCTRDLNIQQVQCELNRSGGKCFLGLDEMMEKG